MLIKKRKKRNKTDIFTFNFAALRKVSRNDGVDLAI